MRSPAFVASYEGRLLSHHLPGVTEQNHLHAEIRTRDIGIRSTDVMCCTVTVSGRGEYVDKNWLSATPRQKDTVLMRHVDPLLGNDRDIIKNTTAVTE
jgi:hypothetical protein